GGVLVQRRAAQVALAGDPQHVLTVQHAPDGGERVAPAEVQAAHRPARRGRRRDDAVLEIRINQALAGCEEGVVFLTRGGAPAGSANAKPLAAQRLARGSLVPGRGGARPDGTIRGTEEVEKPSPQ